MPRSKTAMVSCSPEAGLVSRTLLGFGFFYVPGDCYHITKLPEWSFAVDGGRYFAKRDRVDFIPVDFAIRTTAGAFSYWHIMPPLAEYGPTEIGRIEYLQDEAPDRYLLSLTNMPVHAIERLFGPQPALSEGLSGIHPTNDVLAFLQDAGNRRP
jgi:hypothetical protein